MSNERIEIPERTPSTDIVMAGRIVKFHCRKSSMMSFGFDSEHSFVTLVIHTLWRRAKKHWSCLTSAVQTHRSVHRQNFLPEIILLATFKIVGQEGSNALKVDPIDAVSSSAVAQEK